MKKKDKQILIGVIVVVVIALSFIIYANYSKEEKAGPISVTLLKCNGDYCTKVDAKKALSLYSEEGGPESDITHLWVDVNVDASGSDVQFNNFQILSDTDSPPTTITGTPGPVTASDFYSFLKNKDASPPIQTPVSGLASWSTRYKSNADHNIGCSFDSDCDSGITTTEQCKTIAGETVKRCVIKIQNYESKCAPCYWQTSIEGSYTVGTTPMTKKVQKTLAFNVGAGGTSSLSVEVSRGE